MTDTVSSNMIIPEVFGDMAQAEFLGAVKVASSPAVVSDNTLVGQPGETIHFPKWDTLADSDFADLTEDVAIVPVNLDSSDSEATIKEAGMGVEITTRAQIVGLGNAQAEARRQFGILAARRVDKDLITQAQADESASGGGTPFTVTESTGTTKLSWDVLVDGFATFGDEFDPSLFAGIYINSEQMTDLFRDSNFIDASKLGSGASALRTGSLGLLGGINAYVSDRVAAKKVLILKNRSLGLLYKQRPIVEQDRDILKRTDVLAITTHYAVKRLNDRGVCVVTLAAA
jgi:N4-gp56 family major capsid protein